MSARIEDKPATEQIEAVPDHDDTKDEVVLTDKAEDKKVSHHANLDFKTTLLHFRKAMGICFGVGICAMGDGYQYKMPGNIVALRGFIEQFGSPNATGKYVLNPQHVAAWGGAYSGAQIAILLVGNWPIDRWGRRPMLYLTQVLMLIAAIIEMFATDWKHWLAAKVLNGLSVGCNQMSACSYISEIAPTRARGAALGFYQLFWAIGSFAAAIGLQVVSSTLPPNKWRHAVYSMWFFIGLAFLVLAFLPESPRYYGIKGNHEKAKRTLKRINGSVPAYDAEHEYGIILQEIEDGKALAGKQSQATVLDCFKGTNLRRTIVSAFPFVAQLAFGSPVIFSYTSYFFQLAGIAQPFLATVAVNSVLVTFVSISFFTTERIGRRRLLVGGAIIMTPLLFIVGGLLQGARTPATGAAMIAVACVWVAAYASSAGPLAFVFLAECSTVLLRAKTVNMAALICSLFSLVTTYCTPLMLTSPKFGVSATMFFYAGLSSVCLVLFYFFIPETRNRSFIELDEMFEKKIPARKFRTFETEADILKRSGLQMV